MRQLITLGPLAGVAFAAAITNGALLQTDDFQLGTAEGWNGNLFGPANTWTTPRSCG